MCLDQGAGPVLTRADHQAVPCCWGFALTGDAERCTCWQPVYDAEQHPPITDPARLLLLPRARSRPCVDCAYKKGSPESIENEDHFSDLPPNFRCHQGMRRVVSWRHPDGRVREARPGDYRPAVVGNIAYRADGAPALTCAGWARLRRRQLLLEDSHG